MNLSKNLIMKSKIVLFLTLVILVASCSKDSVIPSPNPNPNPNPDPTAVFNPATDNVIINHEMRAAWVTTVYGLDWPAGTTGSTAQTSALINTIEKLKNLNINVIFFQAMSSCETMYASSILPWSRYLTGNYGQNPGYDPLAVAVQAAHERGIEIHAWLNPLRLGSSTITYPAGHPALLHPEWYCTYKGTRYWNAGIPEVRIYLQDVAKEILTKYDVDGIHFDDYFYPDGLKTTPDTWDDAATYQQYKGSFTDVHKWRENNIDLMVKAVYDAVKATKPKALFGISPSGQYANTLALYANPVTWINSGTIDYLAPQIYWQIGHSTADFTTLANFWNTKSANNIPIFPGLAAYRLGESGFPSSTEFQNEVNVCRGLSNVKGHCWFRTQHITNTDPTSIFNTLNQLLKQTLYPGLSLVPKMGTYQYAAPSVPSVTLSSKTITWTDASNATTYAVYELKRKGTTTSWDAILKYHGANKSYTGETGKNYVVIAVNGREKSLFQKVLYIQ